MKTSTNHALLAAQAREHEGEFEAAASEYLAAELPGEAVRVLTRARLYVQGAWLFLSYYGIDPTATKHLVAQKRKHALTAAILFARGGEAQRAVALFTALGEHERASEVLRKAAATRGEGAPEQPVSTLYVEAAEPATGSLEAARRAEVEGRFREAVPLYARAGLPYETALAALSARMWPEAFDALSRAAKDDPRYLSTCACAIDAAIAADVLPLQLEHFLSGSVRSAPKDRVDAERLYRLALLYERKEFFDNAAGVLRLVLMFDPHHDDAAMHLRAVQAKAQPPRSAPRLLPSQQSPPPESRGDVAFPSSPLTATPQVTPASASRSQTVFGAVKPNDAGMAADRETRFRAMFLEGAIIADRYRIEQRIGLGGMAVVFRAYDLELSMEVALKAYVATGDDAEETLTRFRRELRFARSIVHENVVRVFDIGVFEGQRYITMELLPGQDLGKRMKKPLALAQALDFIIQACRGLEAAHQQGIVHRDIKPANLFVTNQAVVKVMDFGIARSNVGEAELTGTRFFAGTPTFIAPEQIIESRKVTFAADLYSMGVVAYRLLTGVTPFVHPEMYSLLTMHLNKQPDSLRDHNPMLSRELDTVILRCLEKLPENRWGSCAELAAVLTRLRDGLAAATE